MDINYPHDFHFRSFITESIKSVAPQAADPGQLDEAGDDRWQATLYMGAIRVAEVTSEHRYGPVQISFITGHGANVFNDAIEAIRRAADIPSDQDIAGQWMLYLAEIAYHTRRLMLKAANNTVFKLQGDPPEVYHMIRGEAYTPGVEGKLRIIYGQQLKYVLRPGSIPRIVQQNYRT